jgi:hypothetical protein
MRSIMSYPLVGVVEVVGIFFSRATGGLVAWTFFLFSEYRIYLNYLNYPNFLSSIVLALVGS